MHAENRERKKILVLRHKVACFGDKILPCIPAGKLVPRLTAVAHAVLCVPASWHISVFCAKSTAHALAWSADTDRLRLRQCASPIIMFVQAVVKERQRFGG